MKKKIIIFSVILMVVAVVLFVPIPTVTMDDGTREYSALTYKIVKWNRLLGGNELYRKTSVYWLPNNLKSIFDLWESENVKQPDPTIADVSLVLQSFGNKGLTFILNNETNKEYIYGEDYELLYFENNHWLNVPPIIENWGFNAIGYLLKPNSITDKIVVDWVWLYGELPDGKYRFKKEISNDIPGDNEKYTVYTDFELVNGKAVNVSSYTLSKRDKNNKVFVSKDFSEEVDMKIISAAYFDATIKSSLVEIDLTKVIDFYNVQTTYSNGEISNAVFCFEDGKAWMILAKEEATSNAMRLAAPVNDELYQQLIDLLK